MAHWQTQIQIRARIHFQSAIPVSETARYVTFIIYKHTEKKLAQPVNHCN